MASELALPAAGLVPPPPPGAVLMYPKPAVVWFPLLVCGAKAFVLVGAFKPVRLKILVNSARTCKLMPSLIRNVRARLALSPGWRCCR